jgi:hypothetical protein
MVNKEPGKGDNIMKKYKKGGVKWQGGFFLPL